jgi:hypothetical protein
MNKSTPTKKKPIKAHRGRIVYEGQGRPMPRPFPGRPFPGRPMPRPMPFPPPRRRPPTRDPRRMFGRPVPPRRGLGNASMIALRKAMAERNNMQVSEPITQRAAMGNKGMFVTKKNIGVNDFRKGGLTLSITDNKKKKK